MNKMNNCIRYMRTVATALFLLLLSGCSDFTDLQPKGENLLSTVDDLEMLLNYEYWDMPRSDEELINDIYPYRTNLANLVKQPAPSLYQIIFTWNESIDRAEYTPSDYTYTNCYSVIGKIANPIIQNVEYCTGLESKKAQVKAEALVLRAFFGYVAVNHFAKAYNPATAAEDGGVPYPREDDNLADLREKYSVQQVYDFILEDLNEAIGLNALPDENVNLMRVSKAFAYAVKAKVLMSMRDYDGAYEAARQSLAVKSFVADHNTMLAVGTTGKMELQRIQMECNEDLFYDHYRTIMHSPSQELWDMFEEGSVYLKYAPTDVNALGSALIGRAYLGGTTAPSNYLADKTYFSSFGLTTADMYLTMAEVDIRKGNIDKAMEAIDLIRKNRILTDAYQPLKGKVTTKAEAMDVFKKLSRTEGLFTIKNYINIKRWNSESNEWTETLTKTVLGITYTLRPDSPLWIWPFPQNATSLNPNLTQNY